MVGFDSWHAHSQLHAVRAQAQEISTRNASDQTLIESSKKMMAAIEAMTATENTIANLVGAHVNLRSCLQEIATLMPASIRLTEVRFSQADGRTSGSVLGYAFPDEQTSERTALETYIAKLRESPLFENAALGSVQVAAVTGRPAQQFEVSVVGVASPSLGAAADQAIASPKTPTPVPAQAQAQGGSQP